MAKYILARSAGFCFGVERSVRIAREALAEGNCFCLGELIHNRDTVEELESAGMRRIELPWELPAGERVVIRAHGIGEAVYGALREREARIIDATCPLVRKIHRIVHRQWEAGRKIIVIGDASHPEVRGICGWCRDAEVFSDAPELAQWLEENPDFCDKPLAIVFQTTQIREKLLKIQKIIKKICTNAEIFDTICGATAERQEEAVRLSKLCDAMVVIGGAHSANSVHLAQLCGENCARVAFVPGPGELDAGMFRGAGLIGFTAGASVPPRIIKEVVKKMSDEIKIEETSEEEIAGTGAAETAPVESGTGAGETVPVESGTGAGETAPVESGTGAGETAPVESGTGAGETVPVESEPAPGETVPAEGEPAPEGTAPGEGETGTAEGETAGTETSAGKPDAEKTFDELLEDSIRTINNGDTVSGYVVAITPTEVTVDLGIKHSGYIPVSEFTNDGALNVEDVIHVGDQVEACVIRVNDVEGTVELSKRRLDSVKSWASMENAQAEGAVVEGKVTEENKGGVVVNVKGIRVFVPASQSGLPRDASMSELVGQTVRLKITEVNRGRRRVVGSIRAVANKERKERAEKIWNEIEIGKHYEGTVKSMTSYGAFVDIGGIDGMVHVSEISWSRINKPADVLKIGDKIDVYVINFDREARRISLGHRDPARDPWKIFNETYSVGDVAKVKIVKLMSFGAFAEVIPGADGLIHISQIANRRIADPSEVLTVGDVVEAKITNIDQEKKKISLSIRALGEPAPRRRTVEPSDEGGSGKGEPEEDALIYEVSSDGTATGEAPSGED